MTKTIILIIAAVISCVFLTIGFLFKIQHWPGASILILTGLLAGGGTVALYFGIRDR